MGGQKGIALFYQFLAPQVTLTCVTTKSNDAVGVKEYEVLNVLSDSKFRYANPYYFFKLKTIIRQKKITHLIIEHPYYGWLGILLKWFCKVKLVVHSHNIEALRFKSMGKWWWGMLWHYEKLTHRKAALSFFIHDDDRDFGIKKFKLDPGKCFTITYGFELTNAPTAEERKSSRHFICNKYGINAAEKLLLFNGTLDYKPNQDALDNILEKINPLLQAKEGFDYKIIICGNKLPAAYANLNDYTAKNIIYAGFVDDITVFFKGADIFINPVTDGGGIKTKLVEALGYDCTVISTKSGAIGIPAAITGNKMKVIADTDWEEFANQVILADTVAGIPPAFFDHFYWPFL